MVQGNVIYKEFDQKLSFLPVNSELKQDGRET